MTKEYLRKKARATYQAPSRSHHHEKILLKLSRNRPQLVCDALLAHHTYALQTNPGSVDLTPAHRGGHSESTDKKSSSHLDFTFRSASKKQPNYFLDGGHVASQTALSSYLDTDAPSFHGTQ